jgi:flagella basal body P-ring formation protein FlgA
MHPSAKRRSTWFFLVLLAGSATGDAAEIQFQTQAQVRGSLVLLGDVAKIIDPDPDQAEALARIELFPAPARGRVRTSRQVEIRQLLQLHGVLASDHRFTGAQEIRIGDAIQQPASASAAPVPAATPAEPLVVVAKVPISAGSVVREIDVELKPVERRGPATQAAVTIEAVIGQESSRSYAAGQVIDPRTLRKPILVRRGELVAVIAKAAGVRVRTTAKALADGAAGDLLPVEAPNREHYSVVVTGVRQGEILASAPQVRSAR